LGITVKFYQYIKFVAMSCFLISSARSLSGTLKNRQKPAIF